MIPLYVTILAIFAQRQQGPAAAAHVLRGLLYGMFAFAGFFITLSLLIEKSGIGVSFLSAGAVALAIQGTTLWILRQKHSSLDHLPLDSTPWEDCILIAWISQRICLP